MENREPDPILETIDDSWFQSNCGHTAIHRFEDGRTQCKDCLLIWEAKSTDSE